MSSSSQKKVRYKFLAKVSLSLAKLSCMVAHVKPIIRDDKPDHVILHTGTMVIVVTKQ